MNSHLQYFFYESVFSPRARQVKRNDIENSVYQQVDKILEDDQELKNYMPVFPNSLLELLRVLSDPQSDVIAIETVISREPVLAIKVISTANSPLYSKDLAPVDNIGDAIERVGVSGINNIANSYLLQDSLSVNLENYQMFGKIVWEHSLQVAFICHDMAGRRGLECPKLCYLMGLVHDIGKIVIFNILSSVYTEHSREYLPCSTRFIELMTSKSAAITERIIANWHFHKDVVDAIKRQKNQKKVGMAHILFVANLLSESYIMIKNGCFEGQDGIDQLVKHHGMNKQYVEEFFNVADTISEAIHN